MDMIGAIAALAIGLGIVCIACLVAGTLISWVDNEEDDSDESELE